MESLGLLETAWYSIIKNCGIWNEIVYIDFEILLNIGNVSHGRQSMEQ